MQVTHKNLLYLQPYSGRKEMPCGGHSVFGGCGEFLCLPRLLLGAAFSVFANAKNSSRIGFSCSSRFLYLSSLVSLEYFFSRLYMLAIG